VKIEGNVKRIKGTIQAEAREIINRFPVMNTLYFKGIVIARNLSAVKAHKFEDEEYKKVWLSLNQSPVWSMGNSWKKLEMKSGGK